MCIRDRFYPKHAEVWYGAGFVDDDSVLAWSDDEAAAYLLENGQTGVGSSSLQKALSIIPFSL